MIQHIGIRKLELEKIRHGSYWYKEVGIGKN